MLHSSFLLLIDDSPLDEKLEHYFAQFTIGIQHQKKWSPLNSEHTVPTAILIHWTIVENDLEILQELFNLYPSPLIVYNDFFDENVCITVLEYGADDFMVKPLYPRELHARISAISRRVGYAPQKWIDSKEVFQFANWRLIPASRQVFDQNHNELHLSAGEYDLLFTFIQLPQQVLSREMLLQNTKNSELNPFDRRIDVQISRLRQKIEVDANRPELIKTIRNGGYLFTAQVECVRSDDGE